MAATGAFVSKVYSKAELCLMERIPLPCGIVIFGASGDLAQRKLLPALFALFEEQLLPESFYVLGVARTPLSDEQFRDAARRSLPARSARLQEFLSRCTYLTGGYDDPAAFQALRDRLTGLDQVYKTAGRRLFYLSTPPSVYEPVCRRLGEARLNRASSAEAWVRLVVEKPFGYSRDSARQLNRELQRVFDERQIYRIDHYLGKETVQNILMFRFANAIFEPVWNRNHIDHIQITAAETDGIGHRAGYYEQAGVLRDMFQNHLFQLMSLVAMEPPSSFESEALRDEKAKVMASLCCLEPDELETGAVRGQYAAGTVGEEPVPSYRQERNVPPGSTRETFAALQVWIDNWRWRGVPFYLRSGKRLARRATEIAVQFKNVPTSIFKPLMAEQMAPNVLQFRIQPDEGIQLRFEAKHPGPKLCISTVTMQFGYEEAFGLRPPEAYARLFLDVMLGDPTLFARQDWLDLSWTFLDPILDRWKEQGEEDFHFYPAGSWGPPQADDLIRKDGREWLTT